MRKCTFDKKNALIYITKKLFNFQFDIFFISLSNLTSVSIAEVNNTRCEIAHAVLSVIEITGRLIVNRSWVR